MKNFLVIGFIIIVGLLIGIVWFLPDAFNAKGKPPEWEMSMARFARHLATPSQWRDTSNPLVTTPKVMANALHHFADHCATCHANDGSGKTPMGPNFYPPVPDLRSETIQSMSDGELFYVIHFGIRFTGMPAWGKGNPENDTESWELVHFVRHLPDITPKEIAQMKEFNPMTTQERAEQEAMDAFLSGKDFESPSEHHH